VKHDSTCDLQRHSSKTETRRAIAKPSWRSSLGRLTIW